MGCGSRKDNIKAFSNFMVSISMKTRKINSNVVQRKKTTTTSVLVKILFFLACALSLGLFIFNPIILRFDNVLLFSPHSLHFFVFVFIGKCCFFLLNRDTNREIQHTPKPVKPSGRSKHH